ncbi:ATP11 protein-domain-containing protein [Naematelia encephala]|uniref:ATP11 protein-domain-containing protein n=1 Tax=Naematelia encephala TaxID=71784 RepID=A0A1Y2BE60_9TREE|nr:ATP11 protein-domain-containing protein [Naematelia encephala]
MAAILHVSPVRAAALPPWRIACRGSTSQLVTRALSTTVVRTNALAELDKQLNPRDLIEQKRRQYEAKYGDKLKKKVEAEGVRDIEALKAKVMAPSIKQALKAKAAAQQYKEDKFKAEEARLKLKAEESQSKLKAEPSPEASRKQQAQGDRSGIKPLSSILNLPLLHLTPHDANAISKIWTAYHTTHPTLSSSFLSASLSADIYNSMLKLARENPFFVLPLPRPSSSDSDKKVQTDEYEMFYLQWLFHPTPTSSSPPTDSPPPLTSSVIFTPLEEFKTAGEWAQPYLVLTHYPDLANSHNVVLMRGEITAATAAGPAGSTDNPGFLLAQQQAQLLALALQRFYCANISPHAEKENDMAERIQRAEALKGFREKPAEWDWTKLVSMAYGGLV